MARTHDMDRNHMIETFKRAHDHKGAAFVEVYQNCNVFNDGAFDTVTSKENARGQPDPAGARRADPSSAPTATRASRPTRRATSRS